MQQEFMISGRQPGRPKADQEKLEYAYHLYQQKTLTVKDICAKTGVSRTTLYRLMDEQGEQLEELRIRKGG